MRRAASTASAAPTDQRAVSTSTRPPACPREVRTRACVDVLASKHGYGRTWSTAIVGCFTRNTHSQILIAGVGNRLDFHNQSSVWPNHSLWIT